jgi:hypothetical protein
MKTGEFRAMCRCSLKKKAETMPAKAISKNQKPKKAISDDVSLYNTKSYDRSPHESDQCKRSVQNFKKAISKTAIPFPAKPPQTP